MSICPMKGSPKPWETIGYITNNNFESIRCVAESRRARLLDPPHRAAYNCKSLVSDHFETKIDQNPKNYARHFLLPQPILVMISEYLCSFGRFEMFLYRTVEAKKFFFWKIIFFCLESEKFCTILGWFSPLLLVPEANFVSEAITHQKHQKIIWKFEKN